MDGNSPSQRVIPRYKPYRAEVEAGKRYFWCSCGRSAKQPFCDGSHKGTIFSPEAFVATTSGAVLFCGCKHSAAGVLCDGTHNNLADEYPEDDRPIEQLNATVSIAKRSADGRWLLDGGCYVIRPTEQRFIPSDSLALLPLIDQKFGAKHLAQYFVELDATTQYPGMLSWGTAEAQLMVLSGSLEATVGDRTFHLTEQDGLSLRANESLGLIASEKSARALLTLSEADASPVFMHHASQFDSAFISRLGRYSPGKRQAMADRFYQVLLGPDSGSGSITQFIGEVPRSKAAPHRHLYEEAIVILSGEGWMWTEHWRAPIQPGDVIFLPAEQEHSLQCITAEGMRLAGHFYPSGSPAVNY